MFGGFKLGIRITAVSVFILVTLITALLAITLQYYFGVRMARAVAQDDYVQVSESLINELNFIETSSANAVSLVAQYPALVDSQQSENVRSLFAQVLQQNPLFYGLYIGREDGSFYELINLNASNDARQSLQASSSDRWLEINIEASSENRQRHFQYYDAQFNLRFERFESTEYDPRKRNWYQQAQSSSDLHQTSPYLFAQLQVPGQTVAKRLPDQTSVLGIDLLLDSLSSYLRNKDFGLDWQKGHALIFQHDGQLIASSNRNETPSSIDTNSPKDDHSSNTDILQWPALNFSNSFNLTGYAEILVNLSKGDHLGNLQKINIAGRSFYAYVQTVGSSDKFFAVLVEANKMTQPFISQVLASIAVSAILLAIMLPLSWWFSEPIVRPVRELAIENDKIRLHKKTNIKRVKSYILEIDELSDSIVEMVSTIRKQEQNQRDLLDSFVQLIAEAIDQKSPYTGGHCARVPELALMLVKEADKSMQPPYANFHVNNNDDWREIRIAAWLHDCGKVTTPEYVVDKGTKLETIHNRIHEIRTRFEVLWRDAEIEYLKGIAANPEHQQNLLKERTRTQQQLQDDFAFIAECNIGGEFLDDDKQARLRSLANITWQRHFNNRLGLAHLEAQRYPKVNQQLPANEFLLHDGPEHLIPRPHNAQYPEHLGIKMEAPKHLYNRGELHNLLVSRGTLTAEDRYKINEHMISTIRMLDALPFPKELSNVPRFASTHHERLDGGGYPRKLTGDELSIPERMLALADIFEALTAADRPYKKGKTLSQTLEILSYMVKDQHIDGDAFELLLTSGIYKSYAAQYLDEAQIDEINIHDYLSGTQKAQRA